MKELTTVLRALADVSRLRIVHRLAHCEESSVTELAESMRLSQPLISWHLSMLRRAGLVSTRRCGRLVYCRLDSAKLRWCQAQLGCLMTGAFPLVDGAEPWSRAPDPHPQPP